MSDSQIIPAIYSQNYEDLHQEYQAVKRAYEKRLYEDKVADEFDVLLRANYNTDLEVFSAEVLRKTAEFTGAFQGIFYVLNRSKKVVQATAGYVFELDDLEKKMFGMHEGIIGEVIKSGKTKYFQHLPAGHTVLRSGSIPISASEILIMPLIFSEIVFGVLELFFVQPLESEKYELLKKLNHNISATLESVLNVLGTKELLTDSLRQAQALAEARKQNEQIIRKYEQILEGSFDPIVIADANGTIEFFNEAAEKMWGYSRQEAIGQNAKLLMPEIYALRHDQYMENYQKTGEAKIIGRSKEVEILTKDGKYVPVLITLNESKLKSGTIYTVFFKDITVQKEREQEIHNKNTELAASEEELMQNIEEMETIQASMKEAQDELVRQKSLTDALLEGDNKSIYAIDKEFKLLLFNDLAREFYATQGIDIRIGMSVLDLTTGQNRKILQENLTKVLSEGTDFEIEIKRERHGKMSYYVIFYFPIRDADKRIIGAGISARDITKRREEQLLMSQMSFVFSSARESVWIMKDTRIINCNQASADLFGCTIDQLIGKKFEDFSPEKQLTTGTPENHSNYLIVNELNQCLDKGTHLFEWQHQTADNQLIDCEVLLSKLEYNQEVLISAMHRNITEKKRRRKELATQNRRITDSIRYAESIQKAILPNENLLKNNFAEYFILYLPKDIVSGDFYWFTELENKFFLTVADCTGHGVPGAFMSMIGVSILNQIIREQRIFDPAQVLTHMNTKLAEALHQEEKANIDGMDLGFIVIEQLDNQIVITFCGAKRPLYYVPNGEILEIKGNRKSVGGTQNSQVFENKTLTLKKGAVIYLTTDGFADQNSTQGRKFSSRKLKDLLIQNAHLCLAQQQQILAHHFQTHKGKKEQRDDVTVLGIRL